MPAGSGGTEEKARDPCSGAGWALGAVTCTADGRLYGLLPLEIP